jgi:hypothetical protein
MASTLFAHRPKTQKDYRSDGIGTVLRFERIWSRVERELLGERGFSAGAAVICWRQRQPQKPGWGAPDHPGISKMEKPATVAGLMKLACDPLGGNGSFGAGLRFGQWHQDDFLGSVHCESHQV